MKLLQRQSTNDGSFTTIRFLRKFETFRKKVCEQFYITVFQ